MFYKVETSYGTITIEKATIGKIISEAVADFHGKVLLSSPKGKTAGMVARIGGNADLNHLDLEYTPDGLNIKMYVNIRFGTSIKMVTKKLIGDIKNNLEDWFDIKVNSISVVVAGVVSKQVVRRNIEVKG